MLNLLFLSRGEWLRERCCFCVVLLFYLPAGEERPRQCCCSGSDGTAAAVGPNEEEGGRSEVEGGAGCGPPLRGRRHWPHSSWDWCLVPADCSCLPLNIRDTNIYF